MDNLPLELHSQIFQAACLDDGNTARSLSLVSRYVRDVVRPFLYQSLAVAGFDHLTRCVQSLESLPPHLRRIRHLFLSDWTHKTSLEHNVVCNDMERYEQEEALLLRVIEYAAPTLETLTLSVFCPYSGPPLIGALFSVSFPHLTSLVIHGFYPFPHTPISMPRLQRLHLSGNRNPHGLLEVGGLDVVCPNLAHLEISGLSNAVSFASEVRATLLQYQRQHSASATEAQVPPPSSRAPIPPSLPSTLRSLTLFHEPPPGKVKARLMTHEKMKALLDVTLVVDPPEEGIVYKVIERVAGGDLYERLRREWVDGICCSRYP